MKYAKLKTLMLGLVLGMGLTGCGNYMEPISENPVTTGSQAMDVDLGLDAVNVEAQKLELSIDSSVAEIDAITNSDLFKVNFSSITSILLGDMQASLRDVLGNLNVRLDIARTAIDVARAKIDDRLARLDPNNPLHQIALSQLGDLNSRLDHLEDKVDGALGRVQDKAGNLIVKIDSVINKVKKNPILNLLLRVALSQFRGGVAGIFADLLGLGGSGTLADAIGGGNTGASALVGLIGGGGGGSASNGGLGSLIGLLPGIGN